MAARKANLSIPVLLPIIAAAAFAGPVQWNSPGHTDLGEWSAAASVSASEWRPGDTIRVSAALSIYSAHVEAARQRGIQVDGFCALLTAERTFDSDGWIRLASDEKMSTLLTQTGLAIEGGVQGAITKRFGLYEFSTPVDLLAVRSIRQSQVRSPEDRRIPSVIIGQPTGSQDGVFTSQFSFTQILPASLPPGIYRIRLDFGFTARGKYYSLNGDKFGYRPFFTGAPTESHMYSPPLRASGNHVSGRPVDAALIQPRVPWVLFYQYNANGTQGVVADEDGARFALSNRFVIPDDVILPRYDNSGRALTYSLEPRFPTDTIELRSNIPWNYYAGELSIRVTNPDGSVTDLGTAPFSGPSGQWPTTKRSSFTAWKPPAYGRYTVRITGYTVDAYGNRYDGGGTYHFWIANRMTLATATFQGQAFPVGGKYGRDIMFNPPLPAAVDVTVTHFLNSDPSNQRSLTYQGTATAAGLFTAAQGMQQLVFSGPGEYRARVLAKYTDTKGNLWVCSMTHAGVVYDPATNLLARGKKLQIGGKYVDRGETGVEGYTGADGTQHLQHINFPFNNGDALIIASEGQGANKIEPVLTYDFSDRPLAYDSGMQAIGKTNIKFTTSNGLSPHMFPEYITARNYFYAGAPRPGFMGRFLVAENGTRAPYWPTSLNNGGGQIGASSDGDVAGDIYRLIGGVVLRSPGQDPKYAGYLASAFVSPKGSNNNRVIAPGAEDVNGPFNSKSRVFLVGTRPGQTYQVGTVFGPAVQVDPILPANITFTLTWPDGRQAISTGTADGTGSFAGTRWTLDIPGVYRLFLTGEWQGHRAVMPGLPPDGGLIYVIEGNKPANAPELTFSLPVTSTFEAAQGLTLSGSSTAQSVSYAVIMPGAVLDEGVLPVTGGKFQYHFDARAASEKTPTYGLVNRGSGATAMGDIVHLTFFSEEVAPDGHKYHSFARIILRGNQVIWAK